MNYLILAILSIMVFPLQVYGAGLSEPQESYVLVQDDLSSPTRARDQNTQFRLYRQASTGAPQQVWSSGVLLTNQSVDLITSQETGFPWHGGTNIFSKSIVLKNSTKQANPIVLLGYPGEMIASRTGELAIIRSEMDNVKPALATVMPHFRAMSRLSTDYALVLDDKGGLVLIDSAGVPEVLYVGHDMSFLNPPPVRDMEVVNVKLTSNNSYKNAIFTIAYIEKDQVVVVEVDTSKNAGYSYKGRYSLGADTVPYRIFTIGNYIYVASNKYRGAAKTTITVLKIEDQSAGTNEIRMLNSYLLLDRFQHPESISVRGQDVCAMNCHSEILGLSNMKGAGNPPPILHVRQSYDEYSYVPVIGFHTAHVTQVRNASMLSYSKNQYIDPNQLGVGSTPKDVAVMKDTDSVPGALDAGSRTMRGSPIVQQSELQLLGEKLEMAIRTQHQTIGAEFTPTGDRDVDAKELHRLFIEELKKGKSNRATELAARAVEDLEFSMREFVELVNVTPRFKYLLHSNLDFRQREALGFFWDYNGIRAHSPFTVDEDRVSFVRVVHELLRDSECVAALTPRKQ